MSKQLSRLDIFVDTCYNIVSLFVTKFRPIGNFFLSTMTTYTNIITIEFTNTFAGIRN